MPRSPFDPTIALRRMALHGIGMSLIWIAACVDELPVGPTPSGLEIGVTQGCDTTSELASCSMMVGQFDTIAIDIKIDGQEVTGARVRWESLDTTVLLVRDFTEDLGFLGEPTAEDSLQAVQLAQIVALKPGLGVIEVRIDSAGFPEVIPVGIAIFINERWQAVAAGQNHTCAITYRDTLGVLPGLAAGGRVFCWGDGINGALGNGSFAEQNVPGAVVVGDVRFDSVSAGWDHTCARDMHGLMYCWGLNSSGALGVGNRLIQMVPRLIDLGSPFQAFGAGMEFTCGVPTDRGGMFVVPALCWGRNDLGQLGCDDGGGSSACAPDGQVNAPDLSLPVIDGAGQPLVLSAVSAGQFHACGANLFEDQLPYCWGENGSGELGVTGISNSRVAVPVDAPVGFPALSVRALAAGAHFTCAVTTPGTGGRVFCWGANAAGQLGNGATTPSAVPVPVTGGADFTAATFEAVGAGESHACALSTDGVAFCWGDNSFGQLGDGTATGKTQAVRVAGDVVFESLSVGANHVCAVSREPVQVIIVDPSGTTFTATLATGGALYCWGKNEKGQLGDGTTTDKNEPVPVLEPSLPLLPVN